MQHQKLAVGPILMAIILICSDIQFDKNDTLRRSAIDRLIGRIGYLVSRVSPYVAGDTAPPIWRKTVIPPNGRLEALTPVGKIIISSGNGLLRTKGYMGRCDTVSCYYTF